MEYIINHLMRLVRSQIGQPNDLILGMSGSGKAVTFGKALTIVANREFSESERLLKYVTSSKHGVYGITPALIEKLS